MMVSRIAARCKTATSVTSPLNRIEMLPEQRLCLHRLPWADLETSRPNWVSGKLAIYLLQDGAYRASERSAIFPRIPVIAGISQFLDKSDIMPIVLSVAKFALGWRRKCRQSCIRNSAIHEG